jgi:hypothetical protein
MTEDKQQPTPEPEQSRVAAGESKRSAQILVQTPPPDYDPPPMQSLQGTPSPEPSAPVPDASE